MAQDNTKLCDFSNTNNNDFISTPIAPTTDVESCEINTALLNLVMKDKFSGLPSEDAATHLSNFVDLCDMQKKKYVDNDIVKLKLFPFSLRDRAKTWFSSLPKNSIDSWNKCKDAFISKYFPPAKIISLRNDIINFKQLDHEHLTRPYALDPPDEEARRKIGRLLVAFLPVLTFTRTYVIHLFVISHTMDYKT